MLNDLAKECYQNAVTKGFHDDGEPPVAEQVALMHSELSELLEADRKGKWLGFQSEHVINHVNSIHDDLKFQTAYRIDVKGNAEEEIADLLIRAFHFAGIHKINLDAHVKAKLRFNKLREHKHGKKY